MMEPPVAATFPSTAPTPGIASPPPDGWAVPAGHGSGWWQSAWRLFANEPLIWIAITIVYIVIMMVLSFIPFLGQLAVSMLHPVFGGGIILGCRAQDRGDKLSIQHLFAGFTEKLGPLLIVALLNLAGWFVVGCITLVIALATLGSGFLAAMVSGDPMQMGVTMLSTMGLTALVVVLVGLLFAVPVLMAFWFAPALVVLRGDEPFAAMKTSFRACLRNMPPFLIYGLLGIVFAILASIPLGLGFIVLIPVGMVTVYTSYKEIFGVPA